MDETRIPTALFPKNMHRGSKLQLHDRKPHYRFGASTKKTSDPQRDPGKSPASWEDSLRSFSASTEINREQNLGSDYTSLYLDPPTTLNSNPLVLIGPYFVALANLIEGSWRVLVDMGIEVDTDIWIQIYGYGYRHK